MSGISIAISANGEVEVSNLCQAKRPSKGQSLVEFPTEYYVVDIETTGLDTRFDEIIEIASLHVKDGSAIDHFQSLVKPSEPVDEFITELTGITNEMLQDAPTIQTVLPQFLAYIGDHVLVGHNVNFDVNFLYDNCRDALNQDFTNSFVDTMRIGRKLFKDLPNHKLSTLVQSFSIADSVEHRALSDCSNTYHVLEYMRHYAEEHSIDLKVLFQENRWNTMAKCIVAEEGLQNEDSPIYGKVVAFTGTLERMTRREAMQLVANIGGICADSVTAKTNILVLGNNDYCKSIKDGKSSKQKKAEKLQLAGKDIITISEDTFYDMISE